MCFGDTFGTWRMMKNNSNHKPFWSIGGSRWRRCSYVSKLWIFEIIEKTLLLQAKPPPGFSLLWKHHRANLWQHFLPQASSRPQNISNCNVFRFHELWYLCLLGCPGLPNWIDFHMFLNIHFSEIIEKPLVLYRKPAPAVSLFMKAWSWKLLMMFDESQSGSSLIVVLLAARASFAPQPLAPNPKP